MKKLLPTLICTASLIVTSLPTTGAQPENQVNDKVIHHNQSVITNSVADFPSRPAVGNKKVLLIVGKWSDGSTTDPAEQWNQVFSDTPRSLRSFVKNSSQGRLILDPVQTPNGKQMLTPDFGVKPASCVMNDMLNRARAAAAEEGLTATDYDYLFVAVKCAGGAVAHMPGNHIVLFGQGSGSHVWLHEFGHNLGTSHPDMYANCPVNGNSITAPTDCEVRKIKDPGDPVGGGSLPYPAITRAFAGWLDSKSAAVVTKTGIYHLSPLGESGPQLYAVNLPQSGRFLNMEYRNEKTGNSATGVWVRYSTVNSSVKSVLVNGTVSDSTLNNPQLKAGQILEDAEGVKIKVCTINTGNALLSIAVNNEALISCDQQPSAPKVTSPIKDSVAAHKPLFEGTAIPGANVTVVKSHAPTTILARTVADAQGNWTVLSDVALPLGKYSVSAKQTSGDRDSGWAINQSFTVQSIPVSSPVLSVPEKNSTTTPLPVFEGQGAIPGAEIVIAKSYHPGLIIGRTVADASGHWQVTSARLPLGNYSVALRQQFDGKTSSWSENISLKVENVAVSQPVILTPAQNDVTGRRPVVSGTALPGASVVVVKSNNPQTVLGNAMANAKGEWSVALVTLPVGPYSIATRQYFDGKTSSWSGNRYFQVTDSQN